MKKLIFDLDNTLIYWKDEYICALADTIKEYKLDIEVKKIDDIIEKLEKQYFVLSKKILVDSINRQCNLNLDVDFVDNLFERQKLLAPYDEKLIDVIKYLSSKYELIVYTNYFHEVQAGRLEKAGILKYFSKIYGGDDIPVKPHIEGFEKIVGKDDKDDYIMIGDSIRCDIDGALNFGIKAILYDYNDKIHEGKEYLVIKNLNELKEML